MTRVDWYPPYHPEMDGAKNVEHAVSYTKSVDSGLMRYSAALAAEAKAILSMTEHRSGQERSEIGVVHNGREAHEYRPDLDSVVYLQAPDEREREGKYPDADAFAAVESIEFGHVTKSGKKVKGVSPLRKAARKLSANPRLSIR